MAGTLFSVVLLLTPHSGDAAQHTGSFVEPNILVGAASACQTLYDRSWRKADIGQKCRVRKGSWLRENAEIEFANGNFVSTSINLKNKSAGDGCRDKTIEKTILRARFHAARVNR